MIKRLLLLVLLFSTPQMALGLVDHDPILIDGDAGFSVYPGTGTVEDPYRIEGYRINTVGLQRNGVEVHDTTVHFVVSGCVIEADYIGVLVEGAASNTARIENNVITGKTGDGGGISLECDSVMVINNTCSGFVAGLHTNYCDGCEILGNNFSRNAYHGINLRYSSDNTVAHNVVTGNEAHGVFIIRDSHNNIIYDNVIAGNSEIDSYEWDNTYSFTVTSQALDEGTDNQWYLEDTGNKWGDYTGTGDYLIDGSTGAADKHPSVATMQAPEQNDTRNSIPGFPLATILCGLLLSLILTMMPTRSM